MRIDYPAEDQIPQLRTLWKEAFGDSDSFLDIFFSTAFAPDRCRCVTAEDTVAAALYWFDCRLQGRPLAYVYAVATGKTFQGQGLCRRLMEDTRRCLSALGYEGILLVPAGDGLRRMYQNMGYETCSFVSEFTCRREDPPATVRPVEPAEYADLRRKYLPEGGVLQEGENLTFLSEITKLYAGEDFLYAEDQELLGNADAAPGILCALGKDKGTFRVPGKEIPFAMYLPLVNGPTPNYFGLAFD